MQIFFFIQQSLPSNFPSSRTYGKIGWKYLNAEMIAIKNYTQKTLSFCGTFHMDLLPPPPALSLQNILSFIIGGASLCHFLANVYKNLLQDYLFHHPKSIEVLFYEICKPLYHLCETSGTSLDYLSKTFQVIHRPIEFNASYSPQIPSAFRLRVLNIIHIMGKMSVLSRDLIDDID